MKISVDWNSSFIDFPKLCIACIWNPLNNMSAIQRIVYRSDNTVCDIWSTAYCVTQSIGFLDFPERSLFVLASVDLLREQVYYGSLDPV